MGARLRKLGKKGNYYAVFYNGKRTPKETSVPLGTTLKSAAMKKYTRLVEDYEQGRRDLWAPDKGPERLTVKQAVERFMESRRHLRTKSLKAYGSAMRTLCGAVPPGLLLASLTAEHLAPIIHDESVKAATQRYRYRHISVFLNWAVEEKLIGGNPLIEESL